MKQIAQDPQHDGSFISNGIPVLARSRFVAAARRVQAVGIGVSMADVRRDPDASRPGAVKDIP
jgi:hypothetical protein